MRLTLKNLSLNQSDKFFFLQLKFNQETINDNNSSDAKSKFDLLLGAIHDAATRNLNQQESDNNFSEFTEKYCKDQLSDDIYIPVIVE